MNRDDTAEMKPKATVTFLKPHPSREGCLPSFVFRKYNIISECHTRRFDFMNKDGGTSG